MLMPLIRDACALVALVAFITAVSIWAPLLPLAIR